MSSVPATLPLSLPPVARPSSDVEPELLTRDELCRLLGVSAASLSRLMSSGRLPKPIYLLRRPQWRRAEIMRWLDAGAPPMAIWEKLDRKK